MYIQTVLTWAALGSASAITMCLCLSARFQLHFVTTLCKYHFAFVNTTQPSGACIDSKSGTQTAPRSCERMRLGSCDYKFFTDMSFSKLLG